ncbi:hypothetical protein DY000_02024015 [Brassica cretica]|uniref:Secreted protein n=1 Tax=Brassica cretica TaxID=69181 RepID=A0ABQ7E643_BRACR|nr:hypothetical protein DY000_02024015 [Brassica cretica]
MFNSLSFGWSLTFVGVSFLGLDGDRIWGLTFGVRISDWVCSWVKPASNNSPPPRVRCVSDHQTITRQAPGNGSFNPSNRQFPSIRTTKPASSDPPSGKLGKQSPTLHWASWTTHIQLVGSFTLVQFARRVGSVQYHAFSSPKLPPPFGSRSNYLLFHLDRSYR